MRLLVLATFCSIWVAASGLELPYYISKCSLSDPNLRQCIVTNANATIPRLVQGEISLDWPVLSPLLVPEMELPGPNFTVTLRNVRLEGLENYKMTDINFDIKVRGQTAFFTIPVYVLTADYTIRDHGVFSRSSILSGGKMRVALEQNTLQYDCDLDQIEKNGEIHLKYENVRMSLKTGRILYNFWDLYTSDTTNFTELISKHKEIVDYKIRPAVEQLTLDNMQLIQDNMVDRVPLKGIFDP